jgi:hypothetical protein
MDPKPITAETNGKPAPAPAQLAVAERRPPLAFVPGNIDEMYRVAKTLALASLLPPDLAGKPENVLLVLMMGNELGLSPIQALRQIFIVKGRPYISAALKIALVKKAAECIYFKCTETTATQATFETQRVGEDPMKLTFTIEQAKRAGLVDKGGNWAMYPEVMLRWRAASQLCDLVYPDITGNIGSREDLAPDEIPEGQTFLQRVAPDVVAPPPPTPIQAAVQAVTNESPVAEPAAAEAAPAPQPPQEAPPPADPLERELKDLTAKLAGVKTKKEAKALASRIMALPPQDKASMSSLYEQRIRQLPEK